MADELPDNWDDNPDWSEFEPKPLLAGDMLVVVRAKLGLSQGKAADLLGISAATLRNWEQHRTQPDAAAATLIRLLYAHPQEISAMLREDAA